MGFGWGGVRVGIGVVRVWQGNMIGQDSALLDMMINLLSAMLFARSCIANIKVWLVIIRVSLAANRVW